MSDLSRILKSNILPNLGDKFTDQGGVQNWIVKGNYSIADFEYENEFLLQRTQVKQFVGYSNHDFERFSLSAKETFDSATQELIDSRSLGWPLLKFYYSGFFGAHAIMRSRGAGLIKLGKPQTDHLNSVCLLTDNEPPKPISPGMYLYNVSKGTDDQIGEASVKFSNMSNSGGGVHENFWVIFCNYLKSESENALIQGTPDAGIFAGLANELSEAVLDGGLGVAWLSAVRNQINYQHMYDSWQPYKKGSECYKSVMKFNVPPDLELKSDLSKSKQPINSFIQVSSFIARLSADLAKYVADNSNGKSSFRQRWRRLEQQT